MKKIYFLVSSTLSFLLLFFTFYFLSTPSAFSQITQNKSLFESQINSSVALVYKFKEFDANLSSAAMQNILKKNRDELENYLILVDSIELKEEYRSRNRYSKRFDPMLSPTSEYGYYLIVWTEKEILKTKLITVAPLRVVVQNNARRSWLVVYDSLGNELPNLKMNIVLESEEGNYSKQKKLHYNSKLKQYQLPNRKSYSEIEVEYDGKKWFLYAEREDKEEYKNKKYPFYKKVIYSFPIRYFWVIPYRQGKKIVETIKDGEPEDLKLIRFFVRMFQSKETKQKERERKDKSERYRFTGVKQQGGYFLTDKIKYRPYDTLRFKGYFVEKKGKVVKQKEVNVFVSSSEYRHKKVATIKRYRKGGFEGQIILTDSLDLKLGQFAGIVLKDKKGNVLAATEFEYQDYVLPDIKTFNLSLSNEKQQRNTPFSIRLSAKDFNNLDVLDGNITVLIENKRFRTTYEPSLYEKEYKTIWNYQQQLEPFGETVIVVPDSIFPAADLSYKMTVKLLNSNNEIKERQKHVEYDYFVPFKSDSDSLPSIKTRFEDGFVYAVYKEGNDTISKKGLVTRVYKTNADSRNLEKIYQQDSIVFPFQQRVNPTYEEFVFSVSTQINNVEEIITKSQTIYDDVEIDGNYSLDSLIMTIENPCKAIIRYSILQNNRLIKQKSDSSSFIRIAIKDKNKKIYVLQTSYIYAAKVYQNEKAFLRNKKQLFINLDAPFITSPSFKEKIDITVTDYKNRPVKGADVSVVSTNAKFEEHTKSNLRAPSYSGFNLRKKRLWNYISLDSDMSSTTKLYAYKNFQTRFGLDSILYYNFLFPQKEGFRYSLLYDSILVKMKNELAKINAIEERREKLITEFENEHNPKKGGLFIHFTNGFLDTNISWIKVDDSLAFYAARKAREDHFLDLSKGTHKLEIRTEQYKITIDTLSIPANHETILSFDLENLPSYIHKESTNKEYSESEKMMLAAHNFVLITKGNSYSNSTATINQFGEQSIISATYMKTDSSYFYKWNYPLLHEGEFQFRKQKTENEKIYTLDFEPFVQYKFDNKKGFTKNYNLPKSYFFPLQKNVPFLKNEDLITSNQAFPFFDYLSYRGYRNEATIYTWTTPQVSIRSQKWEKLIFKNSDETLDSTSTEFEKEYVFENHIPFKGQLPTGIYTICVIYKQNGCGKIKNVKIEESSIEDTEENKIVELDFSQNEMPCNKKEKTDYDVFSPEKRKEKQFDYSSFKMDKNTKMATYTGKVIDEDGEGLPAATVLVKGTIIGTVTDFDGNYSIYAPIGSTLVFSYVGYGIEEAQTNEYQKVINVTLEGNELLSEIVVTSFGVQEERQSLSYALQSVNGIAIQSSSLLQGKVAGISVSPNLISLSNQNREENKDTDLEVNNSLTSQNTKKEVRNYFTDNAIWQPKLRTDKNGKVSFETTFPDNITSWKTLAVAYGKKFRNGQAISQTNSFLSVSAQLSLPRFLLETDSVRVIGKINSYSSDSLKTTSFFSLDNQKLPKRTQKILFSHVDSLRFKVKDYSLFSSEFNSDSLDIFRDSLKLSYIMSADFEKTKNYIDGEERKIPIYRKGLLMKRGFFAILEGDTTLDFSAFKDSLSAANPIKITVQDNILEAMVLELENIQNYAYACNEQKASKIKAYILEKDIKERLNKPFEEKKQKELEKLIKKLVEAQYDDGLWGWWESSAPNVYMTAYIYGVLFEAKQKGYNIPSQTLEKAEKAIINDSYIPYYYQKTGMYTSLSVNKNLISLYKKEVEKLTDSLQILQDRTQLKSLYSLLSIIRLRQIYGLPYSISILKLNQNQTQFGGIFWKEFNYGFRNYYSLFENNNQITLLAYQILRDAKEDKRFMNIKGNEKDNEKSYAELFIKLPKIRQYFLESRNQNGYWRNTHESASILSTLLPDFEQEYENNENKSSNNNENQSNNAFKTQLFIPSNGSDKEWKPEQTTVFSKLDLPDSITKKGNLPVFVSLSQDYFEEKPKQKLGDNFKIVTYFVQQGSETELGEITKINQQTKLDSIYIKAGTKLTLKVELTVTKASEYVAIEVPIPASCVYGKNPYSFRKNYYYYYRGIETYREEFKHKTAIFCTKIPVGKHTFEIVLEPRYSGVFTLNPASVELMYFPSVFGNEKMKKVFVE